MAECEYGDVADASRASKRVRSVRTAFFFLFLPLNGSRKAACDDV